jgi:hypothetical protein
MVRRGSTVRVVRGLRGISCKSAGRLVEAANACHARALAGNVRCSHGVRTGDLDPARRPVSRRSGDPSPLQRGRGCSAVKCPTLLRTAGGGRQPPALKRLVLLGAWRVRSSTHAVGSGRGRRPVRYAASALPARPPAGGLLAPRASATAWSRVSAFVCSDERQAPPGLLRVFASRL